MSDTNKITRDLKEILLEMLEQVPGDYKKVDFREKNFYQDVFAFVGTTEFEGTTIPFMAYLDKRFGKDCQTYYVPGIIDLHYYDDCNAMETILGDHKFKAEDHAWYDGMTDKTIAKMRKYNAYPFCDYVPNCEFSFKTQDFFCNDHPRLAWAFEQIGKIEPRVDEYDVPIKLSKDYRLPDLTAAELKRAELHVDFSRFLRNEKEENELIATATKAFLTDLKRIYQEVPDELPSSLFDISERFDVDFNSKNQLMNVLYDNLKPAIVFGKYNNKTKCYAVDIYDQKGHLATRDTIRVLSNLYELRYGLYQRVKHENKALIAKLTKDYQAGILQDLDPKYTADFRRISEIDVAKIAA